MKPFLFIIITLFGLVKKRPKISNQNHFTNPNKIKKPIPCCDFTKPTEIFTFKRVMKTIVKIIEM